MSREAMQMALEALEQIHPGNLTPMAEEAWNKAITALRQALATEREWVGLTEREVELIDEMIETQLLHAERCDHIANSTMAQKQKAWDLERVELLRKLKERNT